MAYTYYKTEEFSGGWHSGRIGVEVESQSIAGNYSVVNLKFQVRKDVSSSSYNNGGAVEYIKLDGTTKVSGDAIDFRSYVIGTWYNVMQALSVVVYHGTNGTKTISVQGYCDTNVGAGVYNETQSVVLPTIARKSTISAISSPVECNGANAVTVSISRADASFTHKVTFSLGSASQQYTGVTTSQAFAIPLSWINQITSDVQAVANCRVETFSGSTSLGYVDTPFTIKVPSTVIPVVNSITFSKVADVFSAGVYAQGISKVQGTASSITNQYGATTVEYNWFVTNDLLALGTPYVGATFTSGLIALSGTIYVVLKVKDSRGRWSAAYSQAITVYAYTAPTLTVTGERCDAAGVPNPNGEYIKARIQASVPNVNNDNSKTYTLQYKKTSDSTWTSIDVSGLTTYTVDSSYVRVASSSYTWQVKATVTDKVGTITKTATVTTASVLMDFLAGGTGMAIGKVAEAAGLFESSLPLLMKANLTLERDTAVTPGPYTKGLYSVGSTGTEIYTMGRNIYDNLLINHGAIGNVYTYAPVDKKIFAVIKDAGGANTYPLVVSAGQVDVTGDLLANNVSLLPQNMTFNFVTSSTVVVQASKEAMAYYYPALKIGFIRVFCEVGTSGWALNTVVTIGTLLNPTGKNIPTQSLAGSRSYAWSGIVEPTLVDVATGGEIRITMKNAAATSGMNIYIAGTFLVE